jgi:hypothetical protein
MEGTQDLLGGLENGWEEREGNGPSKMAGSGESRERGAGSREVSWELGAGRTHVYSVWPQ